MTKKLRLKRLKPDEEYDIYLCAAVKCKNQSDIIIDISPPMYGLCTEHWNQRCEEKEGEINVVATEG